MHRAKKTGFLAISSKISILGNMLLHKSYINVAIANILNGQIKYKLLTLLDPITKNHEICTQHKPKTGFLAVSSKHFRGYVASKLCYKYGHCEHFGASEYFYDRGCKNGAIRQTLEKGVAKRPHCITYKNAMKAKCFKHHLKR